MNRSVLGSLAPPALAVLSMSLSVVPVAAARDKPVRGEVEAVVAGDGHPQSCKLLSSSGSADLDKAAVKRCEGMNFPVPTGSYQTAQDRTTVILPVRPTPNQ